MILYLSIYIVITFVVIIFQCTMTYYEDLKLGSKLEWSYPNTTISNNILYSPLWPIAAIICITITMFYIFNMLIQFISYQIAKRLK